MNTAVAPTINFIPTIDSTLSLASAGTWNVAGTGYTQTYNVADSGMNIPGVSVAVSGAQNSDGNLQHAFEAVNNFTINTINPIVLSATPSTTAITAAGTNAFKLVITYSTAMNTTVAPTIAFSPTVSALQSGTGSGWDSTHKKYTAVYNVANAATNVSGIVATISGGESSSSSLVLASFQSSPFSINVGSTPNISVTETNTSVSYNSQYFGESFVAPVSGPLTQLNVLYITNLCHSPGPGSQLDPGDHPDLFRRHQHQPQLAELALYVSRQPDRPTELHLCGRHEQHRVHVAAESRGWSDLCLADRSQRGQHDLCELRHQQPLHTGRCAGQSWIWLHPGLPGFSSEPIQPPASVVRSRISAEHFA